MSELKVLIIAVVAGFLTRMGIPDIGEIIFNVWESSYPSILYYLPPDFHICVTIIGLIVILIAAYFLFEPLIRGFQYGSEGVLIVVIGFVFGFFLAGWVIGYINDLLGMPSY